MADILDPAAVDDWVKEQRRSGKKIGYTCGAFDLLHAGHVDYLERGRSLCDALLVAVNSDPSVRAYKDPRRPICSGQERMRVVAGLRAVDAVTVLDEARPLAQLQRWQPDLYIKGGDYAAANLRSAEAVEAYGGRAITIPVAYDVSTSRIVERILAAARLAPAATLETSASPGIVFLDRDGTLLKDEPYLSDPALAELLPGVGEGLARLQQAGYRLVLVTNQQGLGLGYFSMRDFIAVNAALFRLLQPFGVAISRVYYCPHSLADHCDCRKPSAGLLRRALADFHVESQRCYMLGDRQSDIQAGQAAGCVSLLVRPGDFISAVNQILSV